MAVKPRPVPDALEAIALMRQAPSRGRGRKSPVMVWLAQNREAIARSLVDNAPAWSVLAAYLGEKNVFDGDGKPPTARNVREAWSRVQASSQASKSADQSPATVRRIEPTFQVNEEEMAKVGEAQFPRAGLRNHTPALLASSPAPRPVPVKRDADAEIARMLGNRPLRKFPSSESEE